MILRHRQIGGIPLTKGQGVIFTLFGAMSVALIARFFWIPFFDFAEEFQKPFLLIGVLTYIVSCAGIVEQDHERAQLFMGSYTGISFPAGIYFLPRLPFPLISVALHVLFSFFNQEVALYLGWTLKGSVSVASIVVETTAEGMTSDGVRVDVKVTLILEIEDTAVFLSQTKGDSDRAPLLQAISSQSSARIKQRVIA